MRAWAIASGSNGNCFYLEDGDTRILIDAGITCKRITDALSEIGVDVKTLSAVLVTHEHSDHTFGLSVLLKKSGAPVYATEGTAVAIRIDKKRKKNLATHPAFHPVTPFQPFQIGTLRITPVPVKHDTAAPVFYRLEGRDRIFALMTDTGFVTDEMKPYRRDLDGSWLEAKHDVRMLEAGRYPYPLKRRILGDFGHLSNENAGRLLDRILGPDLRCVLLGHISEENNYPEIALMSVKNEIDLSQSPNRSRDYDIRTASRYESSDIMEI